MAFFYDSCDYINSGIFGTGTTEASCSDWEDMWETAKATRDAFIKALSQYIVESSPCVYGEDCESVFNEKIYTDFWQGCYINFFNKFLLFWNMMICDGEDKKTGIVTEMIGVPTIDGEILEIEFEVDYGDGSFDITIAEDYQTTQAEFMCCVQNIMVLVMDEQFEQSTITEFNQITTTTTTIAPTTTTTTTTPESCSCVGGEVVIGTQTWTCQNLDVTEYRDGTPIPQVTDPTVWTNLTTGAWCYYNNDPANNAVYGKLYNWYAVAGIYDTASLNNPSLRKQLAPDGYHIPTDAEQTMLTDYLGGQFFAGGKLKEEGTTHWISPNVGATNESCFTMLPSGQRSGSIGFDYEIGEYGYMWSSTLSDDIYLRYAYSLYLRYDYEYSYGHHIFEKVYGLPVRLVKD